jgi:hypothetical protein
VSFSHGPLNEKPWDVPSTHGFFALQVVLVSAHPRKTAGKKIPKIKIITA